LEHPDVFDDLSFLARLYAITGDSKQSVSTFGDLFSRQRRYLARHFQTSSWKVASRVADELRSYSEMLHTLCAARPTKTFRLAAAYAAENSALNKAFSEEVQAVRAAFEANHTIKSEELYSQYQSLQAELKRLPQNEPDQEKRDARRLELE